MNLINKFIRSLMVFTLAFSILSASKPAQAAAGVVAGSPALVIAGLAVGGVGVGVGAYTLIKAGNQDDPVDSIFTILFGGLITAGILGLGFIILDGEQAMHFAEISPEAAQKLGVTESERREYNREIDQVNQLAAFVDAELSSVEDATLEESASLWEEVKETVEPGTFAVMQKIGAQLVK